MHLRQHPRSSLEMASELLSLGCVGACHPQKLVDVPLFLSTQARCCTMQPLIGLPLPLLRLKALF